MNNFSPEHFESIAKINLTSNIGVYFVLFGIVIQIFQFKTILLSSSPLGISPQSCTETDFEMKTSNFVLFLLISVVSVHFRAIYDETIRCQA